MSEGPNPSLTIPETKGKSSYLHDMSMVRPYPKWLLVPDRSGYGGPVESYELIPKLS
jgi:hypothetical protein